MNKPTYYVIVGIKTTRKQVESVLGEWWEDKNLPYYEGHPDAPFLVLQGEGNDDAYAGKVLASSNLKIPNLINTEQSSAMEIFGVLMEHGINSKIGIPGLWFCEIWQ